MGTEGPDVHVLLQDLDGDRVVWWRESFGDHPAQTEIELRVPANRGVVWIARHWITDRARDSGVAAHLQLDIALLTSELVGNVLVHGCGGELEVRYRETSGRVTVEVSDTEPSPPVLRDTGPLTVGGQGLRLVDLLAARWGHRARSGTPGKTVWFAIEP